jgi:hypothetical protein
MAFVNRRAVQHPGDWPENFGAAGDGVTDDSAAIQAWLNHITASNRLGTPGAARYRINSIVSADWTGRNFGIEGCGSLLTQFICGSSAGGIRMRSNARANQARINGFSVLADAQGGVGLEVSMPEGGMQDRSTLQSDDVAALSDWVAATKWFSTGIAFIGHFDPHMHRTRAVGPGALAGLEPSSVKWLTEVGIDISGCYDPKLIGPRVQNAVRGVFAGIFQASIVSAVSSGGTTAINLSAPTSVFTAGFQVRIMEASNPAMNASFWIGPGANSSQFRLWQDQARTVPVSFPGTFTGLVHQQAQAEALQIDDSNINGTHFAVDIFRPFLSEPTLWMKGNHLNGNHANLVIDGINLFHIIGNNFFSVTDPALWPSITPRDIWLKNGYWGTIVGNTFASVFDGRRHPERINIDIERHPVDGSSGNDIEIKSNVFASSLARHAVRVNPGPVRVAIGPNNLGGTYTKPYEINNQFSTCTVTYEPGRNYSDLNAAPEGHVNGLFQVSATNKPGPSNSAGSFVQEQWDGATRLQRAHLFFPAANRGEIYERTFLGGSWTAWRLV